MRILPPARARSAGTGVNGKEKGRGGDCDVGREGGYAVF